jgi:antitoxin Phd
MPTRQALGEGIPANKTGILTVMVKMAKMISEVNSVPSGHVLLIDDKHTTRASHSITLRKAGFEVTGAKDGKEALRRLAGGNFDLVLADIPMPERNGLELLQELHALSPDLPVIVMVSALNNQFAVDSAELGAVQYLQKPFDQDLLRRSVSHAMRVRERRNKRTSAGSSPRPTERAVRMTATKVKNRMGQVLDRVMQGETVLIMRHKILKAAVIPMAEFEKLSSPQEEGLDALSRKYDAMLARMQTPAARTGMKAAFDASPKQLGKAAVEFAGRRA